MVGQMKLSQGFSLVELAISMVVVGLVLAFVVKGLGMLESARVTKVVSQITKVEQAVQEFRAAYYAWPGDFPVAMSMLDGCVAATRCGDGDGNGAIGVGVSDPNWDDDLTSDFETLYAWRHLALSEFMPEASSGRDVTAWGVSHPFSGFGGGIEIFYDDSYRVGSNDFGSGHFLRFSEVQPGNSLGKGDGVSPSEAQMLDRKIDDGEPRSGRVTAEQATGASCWTIAGAYNVASLREAGDCIVFVRLEGR